MSNTRSSGSSSDSVGSIVRMGWASHHSSRTGTTIVVTPFSTGPRSAVPPAQQQCWMTHAAAIVDSFWPQVTFPPVSSRASPAESGLLGGWWTSLRPLPPSVLDSLSTWLATQCEQFQRPHQGLACRSRFLWPVLDRHFERRPQSRWHKWSRQSNCCVPSICDDVRCSRAPFPFCISNSQKVGQSGWPGSLRCRWMSTTAWFSLGGSKTLDEPPFVSKEEQGVCGSADIGAQL